MKKQLKSFAVATSLFKRVEGTMRVNIATHIDVVAAESEDMAKEIAEKTAVKSCPNHAICDSVSLELAVHYPGEKNPIELKAADKIRLCENVIIVFDPEQKTRTNPQTGHKWNKCREIFACKQGDDFYVCKKICKNFKQRA